ncbi:MAG: ABC transporter permease [Rhodospirillales bacterium]|nr:ABC transporter permease [Rhodospirillales bacterium]MDH3911881.1 ABC transporter permease [Rhodospirillales bacterium]MDH3917450.1 ABC transporter permease [Rhodospirillales bacterium]MDH3966313.1 ABC transporter permease [Rhodospirillales bacterium]
MSARAPRTESGPRRFAGFRALLSRSDAVRGYVLISPTFIVMTALMVAPVAMAVVYSLWTQSYLDIDKTLTLSNYAEATTERMYRVLLGRSLMISGLVTLVTVGLAYPMAYFVAFHVKRNKLIWLIMITVPFWTSYLLRVFAWKIILGFNGVVNSGLKGLGLIDQPLQFLLYNPTSVVITLAHAWAAFAILPIYVSLEKIDRSLLEAATDLGDGPVRRFLRVTLPLSLPGIIAASLIIFIPTVGDYVTPALVGGAEGRMIANIIQAQFGKANNWPLGAAIAISTMAVVTVISLAYVWLTRKATERIA